MNKGPKIYGNTIHDCGGGIKIEGISDGEIYSNNIDRCIFGIKVDPTFEGEIFDNRIQAVQEDAISIIKYNPYEYFGIPQNINLNEIRALFEQLDQSSIIKHEEIIKESALSKIEQFTSIAERILNFTKEYGPVLTAYFGPYLHNLGNLPQP
ncbi:right-handed parallel beta-helix repeat-containing protein [Acinetobacter sp. UGAL515B_02]|nr:right-handed parallel beta-helix repeat-containing protein [Acinetobacter sp. UGAL515B_02]WON79088.1 right-handed parallel beta-helix repeat-containing protein [Acinetobacter sp. UGAL515B_02]